MQAAFQDAVQRGNAHADAQQRQSEARGDDDDKSENEMEKESETETENRTESEHESERVDFDDHPAVPQMLLLVRDDCYLTPNFTAALTRLLASAPCAGHLWSLERGGALVLGAERSLSPNRHAASGGGVRGGLARKCSDPALVASPTLHLTDDLPHIDARGGGRVRSAKNRGGERSNSFEVTSSALCDAELALSGVGSSGGKVGVLGAIFHRSTFGRALRFLAEQEQEPPPVEQEGGAVEAVAGEEGGTSAFDGLLRALQADGYIVRAARSALLHLEQEPRPGAVGNS